MEKHETFVNSLTLQLAYEKDLNIDDKTPGFMVVGLHVCIIFSAVDYLDHCLEC